MKAGGYLRSGRRRPRGRPTFAAVDLGTNNCRLLVARPTDDGFRVVDAFSRIVRLGEGLGSSGGLSEEAIGRTISALKVCAGKMRRNGVTRARSVATEACRKADNCAEFLDRVRDQTGIELEIINAGEEARLALAGCMSLLEPVSGDALVFDIGGGSTEVIWLERTVGKGRVAHDIKASISVPCGVVSLSESFGGRTLDPSAYGDMVERVGEILAPFERRYGIRERAAADTAQMLGASGTVTTLAAMHLGLPRYDRSKVDGSYLSFSDLDALRQRLTAMSYDDRMALSCIGRGRADLVLAGSAILDAICDIWPVGRLRVADRGLREGILLGLMNLPGPTVSRPPCGPA